MISNPINQGPYQPKKRGFDIKKWDKIIAIVLVISFILGVYFIPGVSITDDTGTDGSTGVQVWLTNYNPLKSITVTVVAVITFHNNEQYSNSRTFTLGPLQSETGIIWVETPTLTPWFHSWTWDSYID